MDRAWKFLIAANVAVFLACSRFGARELDGLWGLNAIDVLREGKVWELLTYAFLHGSGTHLLFNMLGVYFFGSLVEEGFGRGRFLAFYLFSGLMGGAAQVAADAYWGKMSNVTIGASGALSGILALCALCEPHRRVYVWGVFPMPLWGLVAAFVLLDLTGMGGGSDGIAHAAHLGGAAGGTLLWALFVGSIGTGLGWTRFKGRHGWRLSPGVFSPRAAPLLNRTEPVHCCVVCNRTERDGRAIEFRVCLRCGGREYCLEHLAGHACAPGPGGQGGA